MYGLTAVKDCAGDSAKNDAFLNMVSRWASIVI